MKEKDMKKLVNLAKEAQKFSYAPYSKYKVGVALVTDKDKIYTGTNVENASFGLTICAERAAVVKAVNEGAKGVKAMVLVSNTSAIPIPCGACRQVLAEFSKKGAMLIISINAQGKKIIKNFSELFPFAFVLK